MVYRADPAAVAALRALAHEAAHVPALIHHHDRLARAAWTSGDGDIRLKSYCYALRPVLALRWLRDRSTPPPMDLPALRAGVAVPEPVGAAIDDLLAHRAAATEADTTPRHPLLERFLTEELAVPAERPIVGDVATVRDAADALFARLVLAAYRP